MSDYRAEFDAEQRRLAPLQGDPAWREWLSFREQGLSHYASAVAPNPQHNPWTPEGVAEAEALFLEHFADVDAADPATNPRQVPELDATHRYLGEMFIRAGEGQWVNVPVTDGGPFRPMVALPFSSAYIDPVGLGIRAADQRSGRVWQTILGYQLDDHAAWVAGGRPSLPDWLTQQDAADMERC